MNAQEVINNLEYLTCQKDNHFQELSMVCLDKRCLKQMLICPLCEAEKHTEHEVKGIKEYLKSLLDAEDAQRAVLDDVHKLQQMKTNVINRISALRQTFVNELYEFEQKIAEYFNNVEAKFIQITALNSRKCIIKTVNNINEQKNIEQLKKLFTTVILYAKISPKEALNYYVSTSQNKINTSITSLQSLKVHETFKHIKSLFETVKDPSINPTYLWSHEKGNKIQIDGLIASQTASSSNGQRFALMHSQDHLYGDIAVGIKIRKIKGWIGIGICLKNVIVNSSYKFNYTQNYHGSYLISANGFSWSHSQTAFNSAQKSFNFVEGDVITMTYNVSQKRILFQNKQKSLNFSLEVIDPPLNDYYVPCVNMCNPGDEVEIVNEIE